MGSRRYRLNAKSATKAADKTRVVLSHVSGVQRHAKKPPAAAPAFLYNGLSGSTIIFA